MPPLTPALRRELRARAHALHPVVAIGHAGLTESVLQEIDVALKAHELIKIRVHSDDRDARESMLAIACTTLDAAPVQHLGKLLIVWRPAPKKEAPAPKRAATPRRERAPGASAPAATPRRRAGGGKKGKRAIEPKANPYHKRLKRGGDDAGATGTERRRSGPPVPDIGPRAASHRRGAARHGTEASRTADIELPAGRPPRGRPVDSRATAAAPPRGRKQAGGAAPPRGRKPSGGATQRTYKTSGGAAPPRSYKSAAGAAPQDERRRRRSGEPQGVAAGARTPSRRRRTASGRD